MPLVGHRAMLGSRLLWLRDSDTRAVDQGGSLAARRPWLAIDGGP